MPGSRSRRNVLRTGGIAATVLLSGCLFDTPQEEGGHLYVPNYADVTQTVGLTIVENPDGAADRLVHAWYRVPAEHVLQFENLTASGNEYSVRARLRDAPADETIRTTIETCDEGDPAEKMDVTVRLDPEEVGIIAWNCDEAYTRNEDLTYVAASDYLTETIDGTTTSS